MYTLQLFDTLNNNLATFVLIELLPSPLVRDLLVVSLRVLLHDGRIPERSINLWQHSVHNDDCVGIAARMLLRVPVLRKLAICGAFHTGIDGGF